MPSLSNPPELLNIAVPDEKIDGNGEAATTENSYAEREGPCYNMSFTRAQADILFRFYLNKTVIKFEPIYGGFNNLSFFVDCAGESGDEDDIEQYVLKICGRYWHRIKTETEVSALDLISKYTTIPVPVVLAYSSEKDNEFGVEWIVMTRMKGQAVKPVWDDLSPMVKRSLIKELAGYVAQMFHKIPRFEKIGNLTSSGEVGPDLNWIGPWSSFSQFFTDRVQAQVNTLNDNEVFAPVKTDMLAAVDEFRKLQLPLFPNLPFVFTHGDLATQNILISDDLKSPHITAIIDWEWAGSFPASEEFFLSYDTFEPEMRDYLFTQLEKQGVPTPRTIERFPLIQKLSDFRTNLAPWWLSDVADSNCPIVLQSLDNSRRQVQTLVEELREELASCT